MILLSMTPSSKTLLHTSLLAFQIAPLAAHATNGYFTHGYGAKPQCGHCRQRLWRGRYIQRRRHQDVFIPDFGYTRQINASTATGSAGISLEQLIITPSLAFKLSDSNTLGLAVNVAYQQFAAQGISIFSRSSLYLDNVSDQGVDSSTGAGVRLGWIGKVTPALTLGATGASKIGGKFDKYKGLFADAGTFDIPENYGVGLAFEASPEWTIASDIQTIRYSQVSSVGNSAAKLFAGQPLGSANGPGFGWKDVTVLKLGVSHKLRQDLTLRGGVSFASQPVPAEETFFNILAPGVVQNHLSLGATWTLPGGGEVTGFYARAFGQTVSGSNSIPPGYPPGYGGGNANLHLDENILGISYGWKF